MTAIYNPWRVSLENCISGDNYLRASEYCELIAELDDLYRLRALSAPAAPSVPAGWRLDVDPSLKWVSIINAQSQCGQDFYPDRDPLVFAFLRDLAAPRPGAPTQGDA